MSQADEDFSMWTNAQPRGPGQLGLRGAVLKTGQQVAKVVTVADYGNPVTGELRKRELAFRTVPRRDDGRGYDFDDPGTRWACENDEVERLLAFLEAEVAPRGRYRVVDTTSPVAAALGLLAGVGDLRGAASALVQRSELADLLRVIATTDAVHVACHELGTTGPGFLPVTRDHLGCQSWDVRREVLVDRVEVRDLRRRACRSRTVKLRAA